MLPVEGEGAGEFSIESLGSYSAILHVGPWQSPRLARAILSRLSERQRYLYLPRGGLADIEFDGLRALKKRPYFQMIERSFLSAADAIIFSSDAERRNSSRLVRYAAKSIVIPDFFEWEEIREHAPGKASPRTSLSIGFLGEISRRKGLHPLIEGARRWTRASGKAHRLRIQVGGAPRPGAEAYLREAKALASGTENLEVDFLGAISHADRPRFYDSIDALVVPSLFESYGLTVLEALACGRPVLCAPELGVLEYLPANPDILRFDNLSPAAVADTLDAFILRTVNAKDRPDDTARLVRQQIATINENAGRLWQVALSTGAPDLSRHPPKSSGFQSRSAGRD